MLTKSELTKNIQVARDNQPTLANTRRLLIEPILEVMGFAIRDVFNSFEYDYSIDDRMAINYVYKDDSGSPVIAIDAKLINESVLLQDNPNKQIFSKVDTLKYLLTLNGIEATLYSISNNGNFKYLLKTDIVKEYDQLPLMFSPEKLLNQRGSYWERFREDKVKDELGRKKEYFRDEINKFISHELGLDKKFTSTELNRVLHYLLSKTKKTTKRKEVSKKEKSNENKNNDQSELPSDIKKSLKLSDIKTDMNLEELDIAGYVVGGTFYADDNYEDLLSYIVRVLNSKLSSIPVRYVEMINDRSPIKVVKGYQNLDATVNCVRLNKYFISLNHSANEIVACIIAICEVFDLNQDEITFCFR